MLILKGVLEPFLRNALKTFSHNAFLKCLNEVSVGQMFHCNVLILARMPEVAGHRTNEFRITFVSFAAFFPTASAVLLDLCSSPALNHRDMSVE